MSSSIAAIHVAKKQLGLDDDTYRSKLQRIVGKTSTRDMTEGERQQVLTVFRNEGFKPSSKAASSGRKKLSGKYAGKLQALWIAGWNLGIFRERDDTALIAFVKRQTKLDAVQFLHHADDAHKAIEALKAILEREGGVSWKQNKTAGIVPEGQRIAYAQYQRLHPRGVMFWPDVQSICEISAHQTPTPEEWIVVMNEFGRRIRERAGH